VILLAGTIPVMSFVAERKVTAWIRQRSEATPAPAEAPH